MAEFKRTEEAYNRIMGRQSEDQWGADYSASIHATPQEAPGISTCTILRSPKLGGREMHLLSDGEQKAALLALYHPNVWEAHEQRILSPGPRAHFLYGHPCAVGLQFPAIRGTVDVAERFDALSLHPVVTLRNGSLDPNTWVRRAFPYTGDLLLFVKDELGPYALNWSVKDKAEDFYQNPHRGLLARITNASGELEIRHKIEEQYYSDAGIRTQRVASKSIDKEVFYNLRFFFPWSTRDYSALGKKRDQALALARNAVKIGHTGLEATYLMAAVSRITLDEAKGILFQGIWNRNVRVDLFSPVLMDRKLRRERDDVLDVYSKWFER